MLWSDHKFSSKSGATLFEILIVLTILALTMSALVGTRSGPSQRLETERKVGAIIAEAALLRQRAIATNETTRFSAEYTSCNDTQPIQFFPDGTATPDEVCLIVDEEPINLKIDPVTGILQVMSPL